MLRTGSRPNNTRFRKAAARFSGLHNNAHPARMNYVCNVRIVSVSYQIRGCLFAAIAVDFFFISLNCNP